ncbi:MAG: hypothetical protein JNM56_20590, partial [Planctomycetia bacterium]|nr:hypothetical protein [Planctomycetia bacterium]
MDIHTRELFLSNDTIGVEYPPDFDWSLSMSAVLAFKSHAENLLGQPLNLDNQVQDASFFADLFIFEDGAVGSNGVTAMVFKIGIRFSSFAK